LIKIKLQLSLAAYHEETNPRRSVILSQILPSFCHGRY
jgi:hypothetical protein